MLQRRYIIDGALASTDPPEVRWGCQSASPPENNNNPILQFAVIHFISGATWLHTDCRSSWSQLSSGAAAAGYWGESFCNTHSILRYSESSGMLLRPFKNIIISNLLLVGCRTGSLALVRPSITVLLGQAWRVYGSAKPLVCKSLLVLVCEILIQGCFVFFSVSLYSMFCVRGAFPTPEHTQYQTQDLTPCDQIFWVSLSFKLTKQVFRHSLQLRDLAN